MSHLLTHLSKPAYWHQIEHDLNAQSIEVYDLSQDVIRCDATTVSGEHEVTAAGLLQFGHSKDDPTRPQIKVMMGSLDPLGMPLSTDVLSGERADDGLYIPIIERIRVGLKTPGLLFVGDCKMSALDTRAYLAGHRDWYLSPLPLTGATAGAMDAWGTVGVTKGKAGELPRYGAPMTEGTRCLQPRAMSLSGPVVRRARGGMERTGVGRALSHACHPTGSGVRKTAEPCGDTTDGPDAPQRTGETSNHRRSDARGGHCPCAHSTSGGWVAQRRLGKAG